MAPPSPLPNYLYKILPSSPPKPLPQTLPLSDLDRADGFIHLSTAHQVPLTASRFFTSASSLWLLVIRSSDLAEKGLDSEGKEGKGTLKWEEAGNGEWFPHYYDGGLGAGNVLEVKELERPEGKGWDELIEMKQLEY